VLPVTHFTGGWVGPRAGLDGRKISSPPGFFLYIHVYCLITVTFPFTPFSSFQETGGLAAVFALSVTLSPFHHPTSLPTQRPLKLFCPCRFTLRSLLYVIAVYLMLQGHRHSSQPLVKKDVLISLTCPSLCRPGGGGFQHCL